MGPPPGNADRQAHRSGVTIGDGAVIGAKSLVNKDIPPNHLAVGVPAKVIRYLGDEPPMKYDGSAGTLEDALRIP